MVVVDTGGLFMVIKRILTWPHTCAGVLMTMSDVKNILLVKMLYHIGWVPLAGGIT